MRKRKVPAAVALLAILISLPRAAFAQTNFYQGKTISIIVGTVPGGLYDLWGRLFGRIMGKYIPGNPTVVVQNMPGGGSMVAANYLCQKAETLIVIADPNGSPSFACVLICSSSPTGKRNELA